MIGSIAIVDDIAVVAVCAVILLSLEYAFSPQYQQAAAEAAQDISDYISGATQGILSQTQDEVDESLQAEAKKKIEVSLSRATTRSYRSDYEIHHVVAMHAAAAAPARRILEKVGINVDSGVNKISLKTSLHRRLHTRVYYKWVNYIITKAYYAPGNKTKNVTDALSIIKAVLTTWQSFAS